MPFSDPTSADAKQMILRAFDDLESAVSETDACEFTERTIRDVQEACKVLQNDFGNRGLLRDMSRLAPLFKGLESYKKTAEILCRGTPFLSWLWAPNFTILKTASDDIEAFETLIEAYAKIGTSLAKFEPRRETFNHATRFQEIAAVFYRDILKFHKCAYKFVTVNGWNKFFRTTWGRFRREFDAILDSLNRHGDLIDQEANAQNIVATRALLRQLEAHRKDHLDRILEEERLQTTQQYQQVLGRLKINESDQLSIRETLVRALPDDNDLTCTWVLAHEKIDSWLDSSGKHRFLWIQGAAGTGKSVIAAHLARFKASSDHTVIQHFCNDLYKSSTRYDQILKSIILQLAEKNGDAMAYALAFVSQEQKSLTLRALESLTQELVALVSGSKRDQNDIWIIFDGVDACDSDSLRRCIQLMNLLMSKAQVGSCRVLATSRHEPPTKDFPNGSTLLLREEITFVRDSIYLYTRGRLQLYPTSERLDQRGFSSEAVRQLARDISNKADGMFLYAKLIIDYLSKQLFLTAQELKQTLQELPPELEGFYLKIASDIASQLNAESLDRVKSVMQWIGFSATPLRRMELRSSLTFTLGGSNVDQLVPAYLIEGCFSLLEERPDKTIGYIHTSVKHFLLNTRNPLSISAKSAQQQLTLGTLACLASAAKHFAHPVKQSTNSLIVQGLFFFLNHASKHWVEYVLLYAKTCAEARDDDEEFRKAVTLLAGWLGKIVSNHGGVDANARPPSESTDTRLQYLEHFADVLPFVQAALAAQLQEPSSARMGDSGSSKQFDDAVTWILEQYQKAVLDILQQGDCPDGREEVSYLFKAQAQALLYTCRLPSCPRASRGFKSHVELARHQFEHSTGGLCRVDGCQAPPFKTAASLGKHNKECHEHVLPRKRLKRMNNFSSTTGSSQVVQIQPQTDSSLEPNDDKLDSLLDNDLYPPNASDDKHSML